MLLHLYVHCHATLNTTATSSSVVKSVDVTLPLLFVRAEDPSVISQQAVDFALDVSCLGPDTAAASVTLNLFLELPEQDTGTIVVGFEIFIDLISLSNAINGLLDLPETV